MIGIGRTSITSGPYTALDGTTGLPKFGLLEGVLGSNIDGYFAAHPEKYALVSNLPSVGPEVLRPLFGGQSDPRLLLDPRTPEILVPTYNPDGTPQLDPRLSLAGRTPEMLVPTYNLDGTPQIDPRLNAAPFQSDPVPTYGPFQFPGNNTDAANEAGAPYNPFTQFGPSPYDPLTTDGTTPSDT